jgi:hypothetical protein
MLFSVVLNHLYDLAMLRFKFNIVEYESILFWKHDEEINDE